MRANKGDYVIMDLDCSKGRWKYWRIIRADADVRVQNMQLERVTTSISAVSIN